MPGTRRNLQLQKVESPSLQGTYCALPYLGAGCHESLTHSSYLLSDTPSFSDLAALSKHTPEPRTPHRLISTTRLSKHLSKHSTGGTSRPPARPRRCPNEQRARHGCPRHTAHLVVGGGRQGQLQAPVRQPGGDGRSAQGQPQLGPAAPGPVATRRQRGRNAIGHRRLRLRPRRRAGVGSRGGVGCAAHPELHRRQVRVHQAAQGGACSHTRAMTALGPWCLMLRMGAYKRRDDNKIVFNDDPLISDS